MYIHVHFLQTQQHVNMLPLTAAAAAAAAAA